jgi:hypothetical protein
MPTATQLLSASLPSMAPLRLATLRAEPAAMVDDAAMTVVAVAPTDAAERTAAPFAAAAPFALRAADLVNPAVMNLALAMDTSAGLTRAQVGVPVSPSNPPVDTVLFEDAADPSRSLYLPRYELVLRTSNEYAVAIEDRGTQGWALTVALRPVPAPGLDIGGAGELPHTPSVALTYQHAGGGQRELAFEAPVRDAGELRAELPLPDMASRDAIVRALDDPAAAARLVVRRALEVCTEVPQPVVPAPGQTPPILINRDDIVQELRMGAVLTARRAVAPGLMARAMRRTDGDGPDIEVRDHRHPVADPVIEVRDHRDPVADPVAEGAPEPPPPPEPLFQRCAAVLDAQVGEAFTFDRDAHPYIYRAVLSAAPGSGKLQQHRVRYGDRTHRYFQDPDHRDLFYYLPDAYRIPRADRDAHAPMLRVQVKEADDPQLVTIVTDYVAVGVVDPGRLADAARQLAAKVPAGLGEPQFERFEVRPEHLRYRIRLPQADGGVAEVVAGGEATLELRSIKHTFALSLEPFQTVFQALCGAVSTAFQGIVELTLDGDQQPDLIPVLTRAEDFAGELFGLAAPARMTDPAGTDVTVRNLVESPIRLTGLRAAITGDGGERPATITGADLTAPLALAPGASATVHVTAADGAAAGSVGDVRLYADAAIDPDEGALWNAILNPTSPVGWRRPLAVHGEGLFTPADPANPVIAVAVDFDTGDTVELTPAAPAADMRLAMPIADFVLERAADPAKANAFRYRCRVVRHTAAADGDGEPPWTEGLFPSIYPALV